jgi:hypothetical protein
MSGSVSSAPCFANPYASLTPAQSQEADRPGDAAEARLVEETGAAVEAMLEAYAMWHGLDSDTDALSILADMHGEDPKALEARIRALLGWPL